MLLLLLCGHMFYFLLGIYTAVELLGHMITVCLTFQGMSACFPNQLHHLTLPSAVCKGYNAFTPLPTLGFTVSLYAV